VNTKPSPWFLSHVRQTLDKDQFHRALADIAEGWRRKDLWGTLGIHDIRQRYRRSFIGPFWITISMGVMVSALGLLYGKIFRLELHDYLPYLAAGFTVWGLISGLILDGTKTFTSVEGMIRQLAAPLSLHSYKVVWTSLIIFAHNIWIFVFVAVWFQINPGWVALLAIPGIFMVILNGLWAALLLGLLSARFRDIPLIAASIVQVMFFITPVIWKTSMLPGRALLLELNPFYHMVAIVRDPLIGQPPLVDNWIAVILITLLGWGLTLYFYTGYRWRLTYWV
jgi:ABC-2 type transport system permease protein/lipopolysaccharide transport system permease protein